MFPKISSHLSLVGYRLTNKLIVGKPTPRYTSKRLSESILVLTLSLVSGLAKVLFWSVVAIISFSHTFSLGSSGVLCDKARVVPHQAHGGALVVYYPQASGAPFLPPGV
jgi:hypothetical protein